LTTYFKNTLKLNNKEVSRDDFVAIASNEDTLSTRKSFFRLRRMELFFVWGKLMRVWLLWNE